MKEVKKIPDFNGPKWELMNYFGEYCEDFNTCTLPNEKCVTDHRDVTSSAPFC